MTTVDRLVVARMMSDAENARAALALGPDKGIQRILLEDLRRLASERGGYVTVVRFDVLSRDRIGESVVLLTTEEAEQGMTGGEVMVQASCALLIPDEGESRDDAVRHLKAALDQIERDHDGEDD